jgi:type VI secretion system secreted protein Hcp
VALQAWVAIKGAKQGQFKAEGATARRKDKWIRILSFSYELSSPHDAASGQASGKRQHKPIHIIKEWGACSPQLLSALAANEVLESVEFEFEKVGADGTESVYQTVTLTNASLADVRQFTPDILQQQQLTKDIEDRELEEVQFTFQKIREENRDAGTVFIDDWQQ